METFSALLAICAGNSPVHGELSAQKPVTRRFDAFFDLRLNKRLTKQSWREWFETLSCPFWRHCNDMKKVPFRQRVSSLHGGSVVSRIKAGFPSRQWLPMWGACVYTYLYACVQIISFSQLCCSNEKRPTLNVIQIMIWRFPVMTSNLLTYVYNRLPIAPRDLSSNVNVWYAIPYNTMDHAITWSGSIYHA